MQEAKGKYIYLTSEILKFYSTITDTTNYKFLSFIFEADLLKYICDLDNPKTEEIKNLFQYFYFILFQSLSLLNDNFSLLEKLLSYEKINNSVKKLLAGDPNANLGIDKESILEINLIICNNIYNRFETDFEKFNTSFHNLCQFFMDIVENFNK